MSDLASNRPFTALAGAGVLMAGLLACSNDVTLAELSGAGGGANQGGQGAAAGDDGAGADGPGAAGGDGNTGNAGNGGPGGDGPGPLPECTDSSECKLVNDCCTCESVPNAEPVRECLAVCIAPHCSAVGHPNATPSCFAGTCVAGFDCTTSVACATPPPTCPPGQVPHRTNGCWGGCVPATECLAVTSCDDCDTSTQTCVQFIGGESPVVGCLPIPQTCSGPADCACAGETFCGDHDCEGGGGILTCDILT